MDYTLNEAEGVSVTGYPTLMFYPKHDKQGIKYDGSRDMESMKTWLESNSDVLNSKMISDEKKNFKNVPSLSVENLMKKNEVISNYQ